MKSFGFGQVRCQQILDAITLAFGLDKHLFFDLARRTNRTVDRRNNGAGAVIDRSGAYGEFACEKFVEVRKIIRNSEPDFFYLDFVRTNKLSNEKVFYGRVTNTGEPKHDSRNDVLRHNPLK